MKSASSVSIWYKQHKPKHTHAQVPSDRAMCQSNYQKWNLHKEEHIKVQVTSNIGPHSCLTADSKTPYFQPDYIKGQKNTS